MDTEAYDINRPDTMETMLRGLEEKIEEYREKFATPYTAAGHGLVDAVIEPKRTRPELIRALEMTSRKRETRPEKKHGNIPL